MSLSWISFNPLIEEPSSFPIPCLKSSSLTEDAGTVMCCRLPMRSTNQRSNQRTPSFFTVSITCAALPFLADRAMESSQVSGRASKGGGPTLQGRPCGSIRSYLNLEGKQSDE